MYITFPRDRRNLYNRKSSVPRDTLWCPKYVFYVPTERIASISPQISMFLWHRLYPIFKKFGHHIYNTKYNTDA